MSEPFITCDNLVKFYKLLDDVEVQALQGLELTIERGEMVGVVGASGSGKSTVLNILGGLVTPSAGRAWVNGRNLEKMSSAELDRYRREEVGFVWQQGARNLIHYLNAVENVEYPMQLTGQGGRANRERAEMLLEMVGLKDRMGHSIGTMSGGEQQRVAIAIALANEPSLLLADEPTGELDSATSQLIYDMFRRFNTELGLTTLIVSHDPEIAQHVDRVIGIRDGKLASETVRSVRKVVEGDSAEITSNETPDAFEELTVLDSAGRLQIPKAVREKLGIGNRVTLEVGEDGVTIRPAAGSAESIEKMAASSQIATVPAEKKKRRFWQR